MATAFGQSQATQVGRIGSGSSNRSAEVAVAAPPSALLCSLGLLLSRSLSHALLRYAFVDDSGTNGLAGFLFSDAQ